MNQRYIKVVQKDGSEFVTLKSNESFHRSRKSEIKEPTQEEIEKYFPEEKEKINADKDVLKIQNLEIELAETKKLLFEANEKLNLLSNSNEPGTEEKAKRGRPYRLRPEQLKVKSEVEAAGGYYIVASSFEGFLEQITNIINSD